MLRFCMNYCDQNSLRNSIRNFKDLYQVMLSQVLSTWCVCLLLGWSIGDPEADVHNAEVLQCTQYLFDVIIPGSISIFSSQTHFFEAVAKNLNFSRVRTYDCIHSVFIEEIRKSGINVRHLGKLFCHLDNSYAVEVCATEMVSIFFFIFVCLFPQKSIFADYL